MALGSATLTAPWLGWLVLFYINTISQCVMAGAWYTYLVEYLRLWRVAIQVLSVLFRNCFTPFERYVSRLVSKYTDGSKWRRMRPLPCSAPVRFTCTWDIATGELGFLRHMTLSGPVPLVQFEAVIDVLSFPLWGSWARVIFIYWHLYQFNKLQYCLINERKIPFCYQLS